MVDNSGPASAIRKSRFKKQHGKGVKDSWQERAEHERSRWLDRPRIHPGIIVEVVRDEELAKAIAKFFADNKISALPTLDAQSVERQQERARELENLARASVSKS